MSWADGLGRWCRATGSARLGGARKASACGRSADCCSPSPPIDATGERVEPRADVLPSGVLVASQPSYPVADPAPDAQPVMRSTPARSRLRQAVSSKRLGNPLRRALGPGDPYQRLRGRGGTWPRPDRAGLVLARPAAGCLIIVYATSKRTTGRSPSWEDVRIAPPPPRAIRPCWNEWRATHPPDKADPSDQDRWDSNGTDEAVPLEAWLTWLGHDVAELMNHF
jgi:hypothetical protein